ncbi:MAG: 4Fe-4S binding protein [Deltaproteobacteria bacterium]|nr:4Fe-4S binding protein [Deltaproteobacteria bacterium]
MNLSEFFKKIISGVISLGKGMRVTFYYLVHPKTVVTQQYPENRNDLKIFDRFRIRLTMVHDEHGFHKCTACTFCEQACPNGSIRVYSQKGKTSNKTELNSLIWKMDRCTFCNACVIVCPFSVLKMTTEFENSVFDRRLLAVNLTRYSGPTSQVLMKVADTEERRKLIEPRGVYDGEVYLKIKK